MPNARPQSSGRHDANLNEWLLVISMNPFDPAQVEIRLAGRIFNDQRGRFPDGNWVITSRVRSPQRLIKPGAIIGTLNTRYHLGARSGRKNVTLI